LGHAYCSQSHRYTGEPKTCPHIDDLLLGDWLDKKFVYILRQVRLINMVRRAYSVLNIHQFLKKLRKINMVEIINSLVDHKEECSVIVKYMGLIYLYVQGKPQ
jgi:hypothetical protein